MGIQGNNATTDQLQFQTQLLERLHNLSPFQPQRSPYNTPSPYAMGPSLLLPPCGGPTVSDSSLYRLNLYASVLTVSNHKKL